MQLSRGNTTGVTKHNAKGVARWNATGMRVIAHAKTIRICSNESYRMDVKVTLTNNNKMVVWQLVT